MPSIKDVAAAAGVSDRTVSRVVHKDARVDPKTRERVQKAIDELGYVPNRGALLMRTNRSGIIGVMTDVVATTPYSTDIIRGIQEAIDEAGYSLLTVNTAGDPARTRRSWQELRGHRVDGVIFVTMFQRRLGADELDPEVRTVLVNCHAASDPDVPTILPDEAKGMSEAVDAAVAAGHRRIGYVRLNPNIMAADIREAALRKALARHGMTLADAFCIEGVRGPIFSDEFVAYDTAREMLGKPDRPTLLFCGNDEIALQVFSAAASLGIRVPDELSLVGFDDFTVVSEVLRPRLTTVALPYFEMGRSAVAAVARLIRNEKTDPLHLIDSPLIRRESLAVVPREKGS